MPMIMLYFHAAVLYNVEYLLGRGAGCGNICVTSALLTTIGSKMRWPYLFLQIYSPGGSLPTVGLNIRSLALALVIDTALARRHLRQIAV
jgi:hypothetical protein